MTKPMFPKNGQPTDVRGHALHAIRRNVETAGTANFRMVVAVMAGVLVLAMADYGFMAAQLKAVAIAIGVYAGFQYWRLFTGMSDAESLINSIPASRQVEAPNEPVDISNLFGQPEENL